LGLKINFFKSEVLVLGTSIQEQTGVANMLNYQTGSFPLTYLGFLITDRKLTKVDWEGLVEMVGHRVDSWQGRFSSLAAHLILTNTTLANLPIYSMGLSCLPMVPMLVSKNTYPASFGRKWARNANTTSLDGARCVNPRIWVDLESYILG
jgi:hypothetical protein